MKIKAVHILLIGTLVLCSCNIFRWTWSEDDDSIKYYDDMFTKYIQEGNADSALFYADKIIQKDSTEFRGHYYRAKAIRMSFFENKYIVIQELFKSSSSIDSASIGVELPFSTVANSRLDSIYVGTQEINTSLSYILDNGLCADPDKEELLRIDYFIVTTIHGILSIKDLNGNGRLIDDFDYMNKLKMYTVDGELQVEGLDSLFISLKNNPDAINTMIDRSIELFESATEILETIVDTSVVSSRDVSDFVESFSESMNNYKIHDGIDNDGDGAIDEEIIDGIDNDNDGLIDEDSNNT